ncbi:hypothetical protein PS15m_008515 [Mucor circinelloides]
MIFQIFRNIHHWSNLQWLPNKLVNLHIYKMKTKLLCEDVFMSYSTSVNGPIAERDATAPPYTFDDCSGNTQDYKIRLANSPCGIPINYK